MRFASWVAFVCFAVTTASFAANSQAAAPAPDLVLRDTVTDKAFRTYRLIPFDVPEGVTAIEIRFDYTGREQRTTIDVGLLGPGEEFDETFRGWSGGNKRSFTLSASDATPSYLAGPVTPGRWQLLLGVPNIRTRQTSEFTAEVYFQRSDKHGTPTEQPPIKSEPSWYRGDLHMHSAHSDGSCASRSGDKRVPCPLFLTLNAAADRGLDFIAFTDHNTISHVKELTALQPYFDTLLLIPGMEMTTFQGHANAFNLREPVDFRVGSTDVPDWNTLLKDASDKGALVSINHPRVPTGEACMGCGWSPNPEVDLSLVQAVEVINGHDAETTVSGIPFWQEQLQQGHRLTAIGGSDTHDAKKTEGIGVPTTVVHAKALSIDGIMEGIRAGNVFIDVTGSRDRKLELSAQYKQTVAVMGGELTVPAKQNATFTARIKQMTGGTVEVIRDGKTTRRTAIPAPKHTWSFDETSDGNHHWIRIDVRDADGKLALLGNPIYLN